MNPDWYDSAFDAWGDDLTESVDAYDRLQRLLAEI